MKTKNFVLTGMAILTLALSSGTAAGAKPKTAELTTAKEFFAFHAKADEELKNWSGDFTMVMSVASGKVQFSGNIRAKGDLARFHIQVDVMGRTTTFEQVLDAQGIMWVEMELPGMLGQQKLVLKGDAETGEEKMQRIMDMPGDIGPMGGSSMATNPSEQVKEAQEQCEFTLKGTTDLDGEEVYVLEGVIREEAKKALLEGFQSDLDYSNLEQRIGFPAERMTIKGGMEDGHAREITVLSSKDVTFMTMTMKVGRPKMSLRRVEACPKGERQSPAHGHMLKHQKKRICIVLYPIHTGGSRLPQFARLACSLRLIEKYV